MKHDSDTPHEEFRPITKTEGRYSVSNLGRVKAHLTLNGTVGAAIINPRISSGYLLVRIDGNMEYVHKLVAESFLGECPPGNDVNHINGVKTDNRAENLEYLTRKANIQHSVATGLRDNPVTGIKAQPNVVCVYLSESTREQIAVLKNKRGIQYTSRLLKDLVAEAFAQHNAA